MQSTSNDAQTNRPVTPKASLTDRPVTPRASFRGSLPLAAQVRVTVPSSISQLVKYYNACDSPNARRECETACRDILERLEHLVLALVIHDPIRKDVIRSRLNTKKANGIPAQVNEIALEKTRNFATEARISVIMLARCKSKHIRDKSMALLCEALDTNMLSTNSHEVMQLQKR
jgi:hypothetical protein